MSDLMDKKERDRSRRRRKHVKYYARHAPAIKLAVNLKITMAEARELLKKEAKL